MDAVTQQFPLTEEGLDAAVDAVRAGRSIVLPTDTVYGIGADPFSQEAVQGLLDAKQRGTDMPPPVLIAERSMLRALVAAVPAGAKELAAAFWPGPLTLILREQKSLAFHLGETGGTVAIRVPDHDGARELLRRTGPLAVSSANLSGRPSATNCEDARAQLGDAIDVYLDAGATPGPVPSTIVDFSTDDGGVVLREGVLSVERLREVVDSVRLHEREPEPEPELSVAASEEESHPVDEPAAEAAEPVEPDDA
jgi:L-threonylcarbamoyladenylate synthase